MRLHVNCIQSREPCGMSTPCFHDNKLKVHKDLGGQGGFESVPPPPQKRDEHYYSWTARQTQDKDVCKKKPVPARSQLQLMCPANLFSCIFQIILLSAQNLTLLNAV